jgi:D-glycero-beta-D-manno-heptose-7-phosphate kinase
VKELLTRQEIDASAIITDKKRPTTLKTRIGAVNQQIVRIDHENREDISKTLETAIIRAINKTLPMVDAVIIEDYNKGLLTELIIYETVKNAGKLGKMIAVDPKQKNFFNYKKVDVFKPNYGEMQKNLGLIFESEAEFDKQARLLKERLQVQIPGRDQRRKRAYISTQMAVIPVHQIPTFAREVFDVSGAGDTVISAPDPGVMRRIVTSALAAIIANHAAGVVCGKIGTAVATIDEIRQSCSEHKQD